MNENLLNDLPYGVIVCQSNGNMLYTNTSASKLLNCQSGNLTNYNILTYIDEYFTKKVQDVLEDPDSVVNTIDRNFIIVKLKGLTTKFFKIIFKKSDDRNNIILMMHDYTTYKLEHDNLTQSLTQLNDNITKNNLVLKTITNICNNVFYKDRSEISSILLELSKTFNLKKSTICFKNGVRHILYCNKDSNGSYTVNKLDGDKILDDCQIWNNEVNYLDCKELMFKVPHCITCWHKLDHGHCDFEYMTLLKLKLSSQEVIGFFGFVENDAFKLSKTDLEVLESLSQILAYIINNKEQVADVTSYIKQQFSKILGS